MDLQEWELLPDDGFLEIHDDGGKKIFSRKYGGGGDSRRDTFNNNYFLCPSSPKSPNPSPANQFVPVRIQLPQTATTYKALDHDEVMTMVPIDHESKAKASDDDAGGVKSDSRETISQVFFKKMEENEFVDMKIDSPKSGGSRGIVPQIEAGGNFQFEKERSSEKRIEEEKQKVEEEISWDEEDKNGGVLNLWKWSLTGIGAICSFGVAAATICIIIYGTHHRKKQNQKLRFQIYADEKRIKEVVEHASKMNEAISTVRGGVPLTRAHISFGDYFDGL